MVCKDFPYWIVVNSKEFSTTKYSESRFQRAYFLNANHTAWKNPVYIIYSICMELNYTVRN